MESLPAGAFNVLATPVDFIDTWGPAKFLSKQDAGSIMASTIFIRKGSVQDTGSRHEDYALLHWSAGVANDQLHWSPDADYAQLPLFDLHEACIFGAPVSTNDACGVRIDDRLSIPNAETHILGPLRATGTSPAGTPQAVQV